MDASTDSDDAVVAFVVFTLFTAALAGAMWARKRTMKPRFGGIYGGSRVGKGENRRRFRDRYERRTHTDWFAWADGGEPTFTAIDIRQTHCVSMEVYERLRAVLTSTDRVFGEYRCSGDV